MPGPTGKLHHATAGRGPGQWHPALADGKLTATFYCPDCGGEHTLAEFTIDDHGAFTPSFVCSYHDRDKCFHDSVVLVDWVASISTLGQPSGS